MKNFIMNPNHKVVITFDGNVTLARIFDKNTMVSKGIATCCAEDEFDIKTGSEIALGRALEAMKTKVDPKTAEWVKVNREPRPGDYVRLKRAWFSFDREGDVLKVVKAAGSAFTVRACDHPNYIHSNCCQNGANFEWCYPDFMVEVVEPAPKKPEFRKITRLPRAGDYVKLIISPYTFDESGDMLKLNNVITSHGRVIGFDIRHADHPGAIADCKRRDVYHHDEYTWHYNWRFTDYEFYEKV